MLNYTCIFLHHCPTSFRVCRFPVKVISCQFSCGYTHVLLDSLYPYSHPVSTACTSFKILSFLIKLQKYLYCIKFIVFMCPLQRNLCSHGTPLSSKAVSCPHHSKKATWVSASLSSEATNPTSSYRSRALFRMGLQQVMGRW